MAPQEHYRGESYYGLPAVKPSHYGWPIVLYFFVGGIASAAQFLASIADLLGYPEDRVMVRAGRYLALVGALISPFLLIVDLAYPKRWFNMLRIYRNTSPMSIGSWALSLFGLFSGIAAAGQFLDDLGLRFGRLIGRLAALPAAVAGAVVALYTGTLIAATNMPYVAAAFPWLSSLFASSPASTAAAALAIVAPHAPQGSRVRLSRIAFVASVAEWLFDSLVERNVHELGMKKALDERLDRAYRWGVRGLGIAIPVAVRGYEALGGRLPRKLSLMASTLALAGGFILRAVFIFGGNRSALSPQNYLKLTQPEHELAMRGRPGPRRQRRQPVL